MEDRDKFGYAEFGDFFFFADDLYVWRDEEQFADDHSKDVVDNFFEEKCTISGQQVRQAKAGADGAVSIPLNGLKGVMVVKTSTKSFKFIKR